MRNLVNISIFQINQITSCTDSFCFPLATKKYFHIHSVIRPNIFSTKWALCYTRLCIIQDVYCAIRAVIYNLNDTMYVQLKFYF